MNSLEIEYNQIHQDLVELLDNAGQDYTNIQVNTLAWERLLRQHPYLTPEEVWNS